MLKTIRPQDIGDIVLVAKLLTGYLKVKRSVEDYSSFLKVNGTFDDDFTAYIKSQQTSHNLTADGIVGPKTWTEIAKHVHTRFAGFAQL